MAFLLQVLGKGFVRALESTSAEISAWVSICKAACASTRAWYEFYSHIYIPGPSRCSAAGSTQAPAVVFRCPSTQNLQLAKKKKPHQVGRRTDNWGDDRSRSKTIDSDGGEGTGSAAGWPSSRGGSGSSRLECGIRGTAAPLREESGVVLLLKPLFENLSVIHKRHIENSIISYFMWI